jgi:hypothetical protein
MEPILDETSLVPCGVRAPSSRIEDLALCLRALDSLGASRVLRSVRDAADRDIGGGRGLRGWCFDRSTDRDAGRLVATRLAAQPFIDGPDGLLAAAEGSSAVEARAGGALVMGAGLAALTDGIVLILASAARPVAERLVVEVTYVDAEGERAEQLEVSCFATSDEIEAVRSDLLVRVDRELRDGHAIVTRVAEVFPSIVLGALAIVQIGALTGHERVFRQLVRHLRVLNEAALRWLDERPYVPAGVTYSAESAATLHHGTFGPMRDFPTPDGFDVERWSLHTKLTGGNGARLYFRAVRQAQRALVLIGYFGDHLPTASS